MQKRDYRQQNQTLLELCQTELGQLRHAPEMLGLLGMALSKSIKDQTRPAPPLYAWLTGQDLGAGEAPWLPKLSVACACFYAAADLYDDVQDEDEDQPVILASSPAQAINIANLLLMACQQLLSELPLPSERRLALLELFARTGRLMSVGQFLDIHSTNSQALTIPPDRIVPKKAGAEFACFLLAVQVALGQAEASEIEHAHDESRHDKSRPESPSLESGAAQSAAAPDAGIAANKPDAGLAANGPDAGLAANGPDAGLAALGQEIGCLLQILTDYYDIWVPRAGRKLSQDLAIHKNSFPLYWARCDQAWGATVDAWLAGQAASADKQFRLRRLLAQTRALEAFEAYLASARTRTAELFAGLPQLPQLQALWDEECQQAQVLLESLQELRRKTAAPVSAFGRELEPGPALARGLDYLGFIPGWRDVWEVQRWDFLGERELLGNLFTPALILETLLDLDAQGVATGIQARDCLDELLARRLDDGWHYYSNSYQIPPDSDDLGQLLQLAGRLPQPEHAALMKGPLTTLAANLEPSGYCPTWLCDGERYHREQVEQAWYGNACSGVMANLYYGLAHYDPAGWAEAINRGADYLIGQFDPARAQWPDVHYPSHLYVSYLVARFLQRSGHGQADCLRKAVARALSEQSLDGSWFQQPQATAFALLLLASLPHIDTVAARRKALLYLLETQAYDGAWPGEVFFVRPGRERAFEHFAHDKIATGFVLRALALNRQLWDEPAASLSPAEPAVSLTLADQVDGMAPAEKAGVQ